MSLSIGFDEQRAIGQVAKWASLIRDRLTKDFSREWLERTLRQALRGVGVTEPERLTIAIKAVEAAEQGDEIADLALREVAGELMERPTGLAGDGQILAYLQRAARRDLHKSRRGGHWASNWYRDVAVCILVHLVCEEFGVLPTRNRESRRSGRDPSGCSLVAAGLARAEPALHIDEMSIQQHLWLGLPGALTRRAVADFWNDPAKVISVSQRMLQNAAYDG
jgi:hypothetical protein